MNGINIEGERRGVGDFESEDKEVMRLMWVDRGAIREDERGEGKILANEAGEIEEREVFESEKH